MIKSFGKLSDKLPYLITSAVILLLAVMMFVVLNITVDLKSPKFYAELGFGLVLQIIMIATWIPQGKSDGYKMPEVMQTTEAANKIWKLPKTKRSTKNWQSFASLQPTKTDTPTS